MHTRTLALTAILAIAMVATGHTQKPNFSGTWNIDQPATGAANRPATAAAGAGFRTAPTGLPMTIRQSPDSFAIESRGGDGGASITTIYKLDGIERDVTTSRGAVKAKAKWVGDTIVIETLRPGQDGTPIPTTLTYAIDKDGVLWVETKSAQGTIMRAYRRP